MRNITKVTCPICKNSASSKDQIAGAILGLSDKYIILNCINCSQKMLYPQLSNNELERLYSDSYFDNTKKHT